MNILYILNNNLFDLNIDYVIINLINTLLDALVLPSPRSPSPTSLSI